MRDGKLVTARTIAARFGVTVGTVNRWVRENRVPYLRPSRRIVRFRISEVEQALRDRANSGGRSDE